MNRARGVFENATSLTRTSYNQILQRWEEATVTMATDVSRELDERPIDDPQFGAFLFQQTYFRSLSEALLFQAPHKGGQIATLPLGHDASVVEQAFCDAARRRADCAAIDRGALDSRVRAGFRQGMAEPWLDWYHLPRAGSKDAA